MKQRNFEKLATSLSSQITELVEGKPGVWERCIAAFTKLTPKEKEQHFWMLMQITVGIATANMETGGDLRIIVYRPTGPQGYYPGQCS
jgi:hypothetical protein